MALGWRCGQGCALACANKIRRRFGADWGAWQILANGEIVVEGMNFPGWLQGPLPSVSLFQILYRGADFRNQGAVFLGRGLGEELPVIAQGLNFVPCLVAEHAEIQ